MYTSIHIHRQKVARAASRSACRSSVWLKAVRDVTEARPKGTDQQPVCCGAPLGTPGEAS